MHKMLNANFYQGNQWDRVLGTEEYKILYWFFWSLSCLIDKVTRVKYQAGEEKHPKNQCLRRFANIYHFLQLCIGFVIVYVAMKVFIIG